MLANPDYLSKLGEMMAQKGIECVMTAPGVGPYQEAHCFQSIITEMIVGSTRPPDDDCKE